VIPLKVIGSFEISDPTVLLRRIRSEPHSAIQGLVKFSQGRDARLARTGGTIHRRNGRADISRTLASCAAIGLASPGPLGVGPLVQHGRPVAASSARQDSLRVSSTSICKLDPLRAEPGQSPSCKARA